MTSRQPGVFSPGHKDEIVSLAQTKVILSKGKYGHTNRTRRAAFFEHTSRTKGKQDVRDEVGLFQPIVLDGRGG